MPPQGIGSPNFARSALSQLNRISRDNRALSYQLATGKKGNNPIDDAIALKLTARAKGFAQSAANVSQAQSIFSVAETALGSLSDVVTSLSDLTTQATAKTLTRAQRQALQTETDALTAEFNRIVNTANSYGVDLLDRSTTSVRVIAGPDAQSAITTTISESLTTELGASTFSSSTGLAGTTSDSELVDINGDGKLDVVSLLSTTGRLNVQLATSTGSFSTATTVTLSSIAGGSILAGDLTGDGTTDILRVASSAISGTTFNIITNNNGTLSLQSTTTEVSTISLNGSFLADLNGDSKQDVIYGSLGSRGIFTRLAGASGALGSRSTVFNAGSGANFEFTVADFSGDNISDIFIADNKTRSIKFLQGNGKGGFDSIVTKGSAAYTNLVSGDFNRDGLTDLYVTSSEVIIAPEEGGGYSYTPTSPQRILLNQGNATFSKTFNGSDNLVDMIPTNALDINGDGFIDLVQTGSSSVRLALGNGDGTFRSSVSVSIGRPATAFGDVNGDNIPDIITRGSGPTVFLQGTTKTTAMKNLSLATAAEATKALAEVARTQVRVDNEITNVVSTQGRLQGAYQQVSTARTNLEAAAGRILDINTAELEAKLTAGRIRQRAAEAIFAQANQSPIAVAALINPSPPQQSKTGETSTQLNKAAATPLLGPAPPKKLDPSLSPYGDPNPARSAVLAISDSSTEDIPQWRLTLRLDDEQ